MAGARLVTWMGIAAIAFSIVGLPLFWSLDPGFGASAGELAVAVFAPGILLAATVSILWFRLDVDGRRAARLAPWSLLVALLAPVLMILAYVLGMATMGET